MANSRNPTNLDRDQQILNRLAKIEHKVESIDQTNAFALRAESEKHLKTVGDIFRRGKRRAQVYLAANGRRNVNEIARHLNMQAPNVSRELSALEKEGLLEIVDTDGGNIWGKKSIDRTLRISRYLKNTYSLDGEGKTKRNAKKTKKKRRKS